ncbi:MAG: IS5 family transposase [Phycisphaerales bacterium]
MGRGDSSDAQWKLIEPLLPKQKRGGKWNDHRLMFDGILWVLRTGAPWRDLPGMASGRACTTDSVVGRRMERSTGSSRRCASGWTRTATSIGISGAWTAAMSGLHAPLRALQKSRGEPQDHALGRSRGGPDEERGSKFHLVVDGHAIPLAAVVSAGQTHESTRFIELMEKVRPPRWIGWPLQAAGDKGYSYPNVRRWLAKRGIQQVSVSANASRRAASWR